MSQPLDAYQRWFSIPAAELPPDHLADAPAWLDRAFRRTVAKQPADRYDSMAKVSLALAPRSTSLGSRGRLFLSRCFALPSWWPASWRWPRQAD